MSVVFVRALREQDKATAIRRAIGGGGSTRSRFEMDCADFSVVPTSPFAYWVGPELRRLFADLEPFGVGSRAVKQGLATADDFRFVRAWWGVDPSSTGERWFHFAKGGTFSRFYGAINSLVNWRSGGAEIWNNLNERGEVRSNVWMLKDTSTRYFFQPGLTWPLRGVRFSAQAVPRGCVFSVAGKMAFDSNATPTAWLSLFNSAPFDQLIAFFAGKVGGVQYEVGLIQNVPVPDLSSSNMARLEELALEGWSIVRSFVAHGEVSHGFTLPGLLCTDGPTLAARSEAMNARIRLLDERLSNVQAKLDDLCFDLYGIDEADRRTIIEGFAAEEVGEDESSEDADVHDTEGPTAADPATLTAGLLSWCVGIAFGRFDIRLATGEREPPPEPDPFDPLPVCSPGMLTGEDGLPVDSPPAGYPVAWPKDGVLVDDPGHPRDLTASVREVFEVVFDADADAFWTEAAELIEPKGQDIRRWLQKTYFQEHVKRYSKSRRKAPIYWQLATPPASYSVWLYAHRIGRDSLYQVLNDFVSPKLRAEERKLHSLLEEAGENPSSSQRKELAAQEAFVSELRVLRDEVARAAPLWNPNLNDGVVIVTAPLYRLVPQLKSWQKELKSHWDALCQGKYDWAQLAMHLWPERVVPKCAEDRSLAIAHDLEDVFWEQDADGKWSAREEPTRPIDELVAERTSPAVKDALENLLHAPPLTGGRRPRKAAA